MTKKKLLVLVGPTAVGKTALSLELAKRLDGEIISGDSMQFYCGMDIGTAKITKEEMAGIPHHLIDVRSPNQPMNVAEFKTEVDRLIGEISERGKWPILVGGTGLYLQAVLYDYRFPETKADPMLRKQLEERSSAENYEQLKQLDPEAAKKIHPNNQKRVIRALEVCLLTGKKFSEQMTASQLVERYQATVIGLTMERKKLYQRIDARVEQMIALGLEDEVKKLVAMGYQNELPLQAIGYKEFIPYFAGEKTLDEVIDDIKQHSRHYAKRQYTWFRNKMSVNWFDLDELSIDSILQAIDISIVE